MSTHSRNTILLATDQQRSVLSALSAHGPHPIAYTAYGLRPPENGLLSLLGFNGEPPDPLTGHYHLGNGYRQFNPVLMRFNSPDSWSPFGKGGLNAYAYCTGDPINKEDRNGHKPGWIARLFRKSKKSTTSTANMTEFSHPTPAKHTFFVSNKFSEAGITQGQYISSHVEPTKSKNISFMYDKWRNEISEYHVMTINGASLTQNIVSIRPLNNISHSDMQFIGQLQKKLTTQKLPYDHPELHSTIRNTRDKRDLVQNNLDRIRKEKETQFKLTKAYKRQEEERWANKSGY